MIVFMPCPGSLPLSLSLLLVYSRLLSSSSSVKTRRTHSYTHARAPNKQGNEQWCSGDINHMDLSQHAFATIAEPVCGVMATKYRRIACPISTNLVVKNCDGSLNPWWYCLVSAFPSFCFLRPVPREKRGLPFAAFPLFFCTLSPPLSTPAHLSLSRRVHNVNKQSHSTS